MRKFDYYVCLFNLQPYFNTSSIFQFEWNFNLLGEIWVSIFCMSILLQIMLLQIHPLHYNFHVLWQWQKHKHQSSLRQSEIIFYSFGKGNLKGKKIKWKHRRDKVHGFLTHWKRHIKNKKMNTLWYLKNKPQMMLLLFPTHCFRKMT